MVVLPEWYANIPLAESRADKQSDPGMIKAIMEAVSIPVMAKVRIGHTVEAQILQSVGVDYIDVCPSRYGTSYG
jgi:pyridoxal biosynthesis lyase PdxS